MLRNIHKKAQKNINHHEQKVVAHKSSVKKGLTGTRLFLHYFLSAVIQAYSIIFHRSKHSFELCHAPARTELGTWKQSYYQHMIYKRRMRMFSYGSFSLIVIAVVGVTLIFNILFPVHQVQFAEAAGYTVTNTNDGGPGSLRAAIVASNGNVGPDVITIGPGGVGTVNLVFGLTPITDTLTIDCGSILTLDGTAMPAMANILTANAPEVTIKNCTLNNAPGAAIRFQQRDGTSLNNIINNSGTGIMATNVNNTTVDNNTISNSSMSAIAFNKVTNGTVTASILNNQNVGIDLQNNTSGITVGGATAAQKNTVTNCQK